MNMRAVLVPPPFDPVNAITWSTAGSFLMIPTNSIRWSRIAWKEVSWSAWMEPFMRPVSCCGKKPFGTTM